jgi:hypothetical protein
VYNQQYSHVLYEMLSYLRYWSFLCGLHSILLILFPKNVYIQVSGHDTYLELHWARKIEKQNDLRYSVFGRKQTEGHEESVFGSKQTEGHEESVFGSKQTKGAWRNILKISKS